MRHLGILFFSIIWGQICWAQGPYPPAAGMPGSTAIEASSSMITRWGTKVQLDRGWMQHNDTTLGKPTVGDTADAMGKADYSVISLGDGGSITYIFDQPLKNRGGFDFAIFENGLNDSFLELATVSVSSDGVNFVEFPAHSLTHIQQQIGSFGYVKASDLDRLAGKYRAGYGTPFDLQDLDTSTLLNIQQITHIKITDVVGDMSSALTKRDRQGNPINDPWPTPYPSGGFDIDAIGIMDWGSLSVQSTPKQKVRLYPNPCSDQVFIEGELENWIITDVQGKEVLSGQGHVAWVGLLNPGLYYFISPSTQCPILIQR